MYRIIPSQKEPVNISTEILAGISSFLATAYIIVVNPSILSQAGMPFPAVLTATILVTFLAVWPWAFMREIQYLLHPVWG